MTKEWSIPAATSSAAPLASSTSPPVGKQTVVSNAVVPSGVAGGVMSTRADEGVFNIAEQQSLNRRERLASLLVAPHEHYDPVVPYLDSLDTSTLLDVLGDAIDGGMALQLYGRIRGARPLVAAALYVAELARVQNIHFADARLRRAGDALDTLSRAQQAEILSYLLRHKGAGMTAERLVEGAMTLREARQQQQEDEEAQLDEGAGRGAHDPASSPLAEAGEESQTLGDAVGASVAGAQMPSPTRPLDWKPPGGQPGGYYIGTSAHTEIAAVYRAAHIGDEVFTNSTSIEKIIEAFRELSPRSKASAERVDPAMLMLRPDIANLSPGKRHIYEIKPWRAQSEGAAKVRIYRKVLEQAGLRLTLGPMGEPGTYGALPAPAGAFIFQCVEPGVITYQYRHAIAHPVRVRQRAPGRVREYRWEFRPLTREQKQAVAAVGIGTAVLMVLMTMLASVTA